MEYAEHAIFAGLLAALTLLYLHGVVQAKQAWPSHEPSKPPRAADASASPAPSENNATVPSSVDARSPQA